MTDLITIDAELFDDQLFIERTPLGYTVFSSDREGESISGAYDDKKTADAFVAGYLAAMEHMERMT